MFHSSRLKKNIKNEKFLNSTEINTDTINGLSFPKTDGTNSQLLSTDGTGNLIFIDSVNLAHIDIITDDSPQLGGDLDINNNDITGTGNISISGDITASNLNINGETTHINTSTLTVEDPLIYLGKNNTADTIDLGWYGKYVSSGTKYAGLIRDSTDGKFKFISTSTEPTTSVSNFSLNDIECGAISSSTITSINNSVSINTSNISGNITNIVNHSNIINQNTSNITTNTSNISTNTSNISTNTSNISTNTSNISTNTSNISTNTSNISTNTSNITSNDTDIESNRTDIASLNSSVTTNINNISTNTGKWSINGSELYRLSNVGIGTNNPTNLLDIRANNDSLIEAFKVRNNSSGSSSGVSQVITTAGSGDAFSRYYAGNHFSVGVDNSINSLKLVEGNGLDGVKGIIIDNDGNVGIGTDNPNELLHIKGAHGNIICEGTNSSGNFHAGVDIIPQSRIRTRGIRIRNGTTDNMRWLIGNKYNSSLDNLNFLYTSTGEGSNAGNYSEIMTIKTDGSVGIGSNDPKYNLHIYENDSGQYLQARFENANTSGRSGIQLKNGTHTLNLQQNNGYGILENYGVGGMNFYQKGTGSYYFKTTDSNTDRMYIGSDGKVGIGRTNPSYLLDVNGTFRTNTDAYLENDIVLGQGNNNRFKLHTRQSNNGDFLSIVPDNSSGGWEWNKGITLQRDGNIGIGRTNPSHKLDVNGNSKIDGTLQVYSSGEGLQLGNHEIKLTNSGVCHYSIVNDDGGFLDIRNTSSAELLGTSGTSLMSITSAGNVGIGVPLPSEKLHVTGSVLGNIFKTNQTAYGMNVNHEVLSMSTSNSTECRRFLLKHKSNSGGVFRCSIDYQGNSTAPQSEFFSIVGNGKIGIGTYDPQSRFHLRGTHSSVGDGGHLYFTTTQDSYPVFQQLNWSHDNIALSFDSYYNGSWKMGDTGSSNSCCQWYKISDNLNLRYAYDTQQGNSITWNDGIVVNLKTGNVGIGGSSNPLYKLIVTGDIKCNDFETTKFIIDDNVIKTHHGGDFIIDTANDIVFREDADVKMTMNAIGNLGIGTNSPDTLLHLHSSSSNVYTGTYAMGSDSLFKVVSYQDKSSNANGAVIGAFGLKRSARNAFINFHRGGGDAGGYMTFTAIDDTQILKLKDNVETPKYFVGGAGSIICMEILEFTGGNNGASNSFTDIVSKNYVKKVASSIVYVEIKVDYTISGHASDTFESRIKAYDGSTADYGRSVRQQFVNNKGGGSRSGDLNACFFTTDVYSVAGATITFTLQFQRNTADDTAYFSDGCFKVFEIAT